MSSTEVVENIIRTCDELGVIELSGIKLESADPRLLDVSDMDLDEHVAAQPSAIAYYGTLLKEAQRNLDALERAYKRWEKKKYAEAKAKVMSGTTPSAIKVEDVKAQFIIDNEAEIERWEDQVAKFQHQRDTLEMWFKAWDHKGFSIGRHANITEDERFNSSPSLSRSSWTPRAERCESPAKHEDADRGSLSRRSSLARVRGLINKNKDKE